MLSSLGVIMKLPSVRRRVAICLALPSSFWAHLCRTSAIVRRPTSNASRTAGTTSSCGRPDCTVWSQSCRLPFCGRIGTSPGPSRDNSVTATSVAASFLELLVRLSRSPEPKQTWQLSLAPLCSPDRQAVALLPRRGVPRGTPSLTNSASAPSIVLLPMASSKVDGKNKRRIGKRLEPQCFRMVILRGLGEI